MSSLRSLREQSFSKKKNQTQQCIPVVGTDGVCVWGTATGIRAGFYLGFLFGGKALVRGVRWDCSVATVR